MKAEVYEKTTDRPWAESKTGPAKSGADKQDMIKKMEEAGRPGPGHHALNVLTGNWKAEVKCWSEPGGSSEVTPGTAKVEWILEGRFLQEDFQGQMMGKPFSGISLIGYDNIKQTFNSVWVSDSQTSMFVTEGKGESGNKVITMEGKSSCAATGRKEVPMRTVLRVINADKHVFEMFDGSQGYGKTMEITYTRR